MTMFKNITALAWDVDGTLVDSEPLHEKALKYTCRQYDVDFSLYEDFQFIGLSSDKIWDMILEKMNPDVTKEKWLLTISEYYCDHIEEVIPIPYALEILEKMHKAGFPQIAVSNSERIIVEKTLSYFGMDKFLQTAVTLDDVTKPKPDPQPYLMGAEKLNLNPASMLVIEDSITGAQAGWAAGMRVIGLKGVFEDIPKASYMVSSLREIPALLEKP